MLGGNSKLKLLIYYTDNSKPDTMYSFDGRFHLTGGKPRLTDDPKYWTIENGRRDLQNKFANLFSHRQNLKYIAIVDGSYPTLGKKLREYDLNAGQWTTPESVNQQRHTAHIVQREQKKTETYTYRLSVPMLKKTPTEDVKWKNLFTSETDEGEALVNLVGQFVAWLKTSPALRPQSIGQIYGDGKKKYGVNEAAPRFAWFDVQNLKPRYHSTQREVASYTRIQNAYKNFEEMISNYTA